MHLQPVAGFERFIGMEQYATGTQVPARSLKVLAIVRVL
jgi:hypothetical protein